MKLPYQGAFKKIIASLVAKRNREEFSSLLLNKSEMFKILPTKNIELEVISFSCLRDFEEQILSILSFLKYAGKPTKWILYSDGTHTTEQLSIINRLFDFVEVRNWDYSPNKFEEYKTTWESYTKYNILGRRLYAYSNHSVDKMSLFIDSDILFYKKSAELLDIAITDGNNWICPDVAWGTLDSRYLSTSSRDMYQLNGGFFITNRNFSWKKVYEYLASLGHKYEYFSDQTAFHIAFKEQDSKVLDPRFFVVNCSDQFVLGNYFLPENIAMRHFVSPIRHKMWQQNWKWHLGL